MHYEMCSKTTLLLEEKDAEIHKLKDIIKHQSITIDFLDRKMLDFRLLNDELALKLEELEAYKKANPHKNFFQKEKPLNNVNTDTIITNNDPLKKNQDSDVRKNEVGKKHFGAEMHIKTHKEKETSYAEENNTTKCRNSGTISCYIPTPAISSQISRKELTKIEKFTAKICQRLPPVPFTFPKKVDDDRKIEKGLKLSHNAHQLIKPKLHRAEGPKPRVTDKSFYYGNCEIAYQPHGPSPARYSEPWNCEASI
ncbi:unnamed protein product [Caenorhabditis nigoni]